MKHTDFKLSIAEEFTILTLIGEEMLKSKKFTMGNRKIYSITAIFAELFLNEKLAFDEKQQLVVINSHLTGTKYIDIVLKTIDTKKLMELKNWIEYFYVHSRLCNNVYDELVQSVIDKNVLQVQNKNGLFGISKKKYMDKYNIGDCIIQKIRAELLEDGEVDEHTKYLALILESNKMLVYYFSEYECSSLKSKMEKLYESKSNEKYKLIKKALAEFEMDSLVAAISGLV